MGDTTQEKEAPKAPSQPGIYEGIPDTDYHAGPGISNSGLSLIIERSPLHYWDRYLNPEREDEGDTKEWQITGKAAHCLILEGQEEFFRRYAILPQDLSKLDRRSSTNREKIAAWTAEAAKSGRAVVSSDTLELAQAMRKQVEAHPKAANLVDRGQGELSVYWTDEHTGELCRVRPDYLIRPQGGEIAIITDLKTTEDAGPAAFKKSVGRYGYYRQQPFYKDGVREVLGVTEVVFLFLVIEKKPPYAVGVYAVDEAGEAFGRGEIRAALDTYHHCRETGQWPAYSPTVQMIDLPRWVTFDKS